MALLAQALGEKRTGELIVAGTELEAHLFLQEGRFAWAYNNVERSSFLQELRWATKLGDDVLQEVFEDCRRTKAHVAETILAWGLASRHDVRRALWWQISTTLRLLRNCEETEAIFLARQSARYSDELTFTEEEFERETFSDPPGEQDLGRDVHDSSLPPSRLAVLRQSDQKIESAVSQAIPSAIWARMCRTGQTTTVPDINLRMLVDELVKFDVREGVFRRKKGWVLALRAPTGGMLCCGLRSDALLNRARAALQERLQSPPPEPSGLHLGGALPASPGFPDNAEFSGILGQFEFVAALVVIDPKGVHVLRRAGVPELLPDALHDLTSLLSAPLDAILNPPADCAPMPLMPGVRLLLSGLQCFGASPENDPSTAVWVALDASAAEGFGWGILASALKTFSLAVAGAPKPAVQVVNPPPSPPGSGLGRSRAR